MSKHFFWMGCVRARPIRLWWVLCLSGCYNMVKDFLVLDLAHPQWQWHGPAFYCNSGGRGPPSLTEYRGRGRRKLGSKGQAVQFPIMVCSRKGCCTDPGASWLEPL